MPSTRRALMLKRPSGGALPSALPPLLAVSKRKEYRLWTLR